MRQEEHEVLVVGAGPVGLTLALALDRQGVRVGIVEKSTSFSGESKAVTIQPRVLEMFHLLGVQERLSQAGLLARSMTMHVGQELATTLRYDRLPSPFPYLLHLHQGETERLLCAALEERGVSVVRATALDDFTVADGGVTARLLGPGGAAREVRARYLVGCDGGHSRVRQRLGLTMTGERHENNWIMADVSIPNMPLSRDVRHGFILEDYPCVILPMSGGYCRLIAARGAGSPNEGQEPTLDEFRAVLTRLGFGDWQLEKPLWLTNYKPSQFIVSRFCKGPVFVAGDAAHVNSPIAAQGLNTGVMDAMNLAWKLTWALRRGGGQSLLDSYHDERHPVVLGMFRANDRLTRMVFGKNRLLRAVARRNLKLLRIPALNLRNVSGSTQLAVSYRASALVQSGYDPSGARKAARAFGWGSLRPGERAPHLEVSGRGERGLYDLLRGDRHVLLLLSGRGDAVWLEAARHRLEARHGEWLDVHCIVHADGPRGRTEERAGWWRDPAFAAHRALGAHHGAGVLLRPDAFIAARFAAADVDEVERYAKALSSR
jgi:2-polyprenyl-6-methoxyphenol hydroxylase-like FAD-dependent oxidoreductase